MEREELRRFMHKYRSLADENDRQRKLIRDLQRVDHLFKVVQIKRIYVIRENFQI